MLYSPVNPERLYEIIGPDEEPILECFEDFITHYPGVMEEIKTAVEMQDFNGLNNAAHKLKGALSYLAARPAFQAAEELELAGKIQHKEGLDQKLARLKILCGDVIEFMVNFKNPPSLMEPYE